MEIDKLVTERAKKLPILQRALGNRAANVNGWAMREIDHIVTDPKEELEVLAKELMRRRLGDSITVYEDDRVIGWVDGRKEEIRSTMGSPAFAQASEEICKKLEGGNLAPRRAG